MSLLLLVLFFPLFFSIFFLSLQKGLLLILLLSVSGFFSIAHHHFSWLFCALFREGAAAEWWSSLSLSPTPLTRLISLSRFLHVPFLYLPFFSLRPLLSVSSVGSRWTWIRPPLRTGRRRVIWWAPWSAVSLIRALSRRTRGWPCHLWTPIRAALEVRRDTTQAHTPFNIWI